MNRELMLDIEERIRTFPEAYNQSTFIHIPKRLAEDFDPRAFKTRPMCGAMACVAGHAAIMTHNIPKELKEWIDKNQWAAHYTIPQKYESLNWQELGAEALDLTENQADWLFHEDRSEEDMPDILHALGTGKKFWKVVVKYDEDYDPSDAKEDFA